MTSILRPTQGNSYVGTLKDEECASTTLPVQIGVDIYHVITGPT